MSPNQPHDDIEHEEIQEPERAPDGDGIRRRQVKRDTLCMDDFFEINEIEKSTQDMFVEYDKNGEGHFTKNEVLNIITDLKKSSYHNNELTASNKMMKKMLYGAVVFFFLLVGSLFGVSIAVAVLTKETSVQDGTLYNKDGSAIIATDSRADKYDVDTFDFGDCLTAGTVETIKSHVEEGKNVIVSRHHVDGTSHELEMLTASGAIYNDQTGVACYPLPERPDKLYCVFPHSEVCAAPENRRRSRHLAAGGNCKNANNKHCQPDEPEPDPGAGCVCDAVTICLGENDPPYVDSNGMEHYPYCFYPCDMDPVACGGSFSCSFYPETDQPGYPCMCDEPNQLVCQNFQAPHWTCPI